MSTAYYAEPSLVSRRASVSSDVNTEDFMELKLMELRAAMDKQRQHRLMSAKKPITNPASEALKRAWAKGIGQGQQGPFSRLVSRPVSLSGWSSPNPSFTHGLASPQGHRSPHTQGSTSPRGPITPHPLGNTSPHEPSSPQGHRSPRAQASTSPRGPITPHPLENTSHREPISPQHAGTTSPHGLLSPHQQGDASPHGTSSPLPPGFPSPSYRRSPTFLSSPPHSPAFQLSPPHTPAFQLPPRHSPAFQVSPPHSPALHPSPPHSSMPGACRPLPSRSSMTACQEPSRGSLTACQEASRGSMTACQENSTPRSPTGHLWVMSSPRPPTSPSTPSYRPLSSSSQDYPITPDPLARPPSPAPTQSSRAPMSDPPPSLVVQAPLPSPHGPRSSMPPPTAPVLWHPLSSEGNHREPYIIIPISQSRTIPWITPPSPPRPPVTPPPPPPVLESIAVGPTPRSGTPKLHSSHGPLQSPQSIKAKPPWADFPLPVSYTKTPIVQDTSSRSHTPESAEAQGSQWGGSEAAGEAELGLLPLSSGTRSLPAVGGGASQHGLEWEEELTSRASLPTARPQSQQRTAVVLYEVPPPPGKERKPSTDEKCVGVPYAPWYRFDECNPSGRLIDGEYCEVDSHDYFREAWLDWRLATRGRPGEAQTNPIPTPPPPLPPKKLFTVLGINTTSQAVGSSASGGGMPVYSRDQSPSKWRSNEVPVSTPCHHKGCFCHECGKVKPYEDKPVPMDYLKAMELIRMMEERENKYLFAHEPLFMQKKDEIIVTTLKKPNPTDRLPDMVLEHYEFQGSFQKRC